MEGFENEGKAVGVVIDVSLRHEQDGRRLIDNLKKSLIGLTKHCLEDDVDMFYLYHPELVEALTLHGDQFCAIGNYETDGWQLQLGMALKQTLYVIAAEDIYLRKYVIYITDRVQNHLHLEKALHLNRKDMIEAHFILIGIGDHYNRESMLHVEQLGDVDESVTYIHLNIAADLTPSLFKEHHNGEANSYCTTDE